MRLFFLLCMSIVPLLSENVNRTFDCTKIFEARKAELVSTLEAIDEQQQALDALKAATTDLLDKKEAALQSQEQNITKTLALIEAKESNVEKLVAQNKQILDEITKAKQDKISDIYVKMKPAASASIFNEMAIEEASEILRVLPPKIVSQIFAKMAPGKAAQLTNAIHAPLETTR